MRSTVLLAALAALVALAPGALAQRGKRSHVNEIQWVEGDLDALVEEARLRNVPLVVFAVLAEEEHNEAWRIALGHNARLGQGLAGAMAVYASNGQPPPGADLKLHGKLFDQAYQRFVAEEEPEGEWKLPEAIIVRPDGTVFARLGTGHPPSDADVIDVTADLIEEVGPGVSRADLARLQELRATAREEHAAEDWIPAQAAWRRILSIAEAGEFAEEAREHLPDALEGARELVATALDGVDESNVVVVYSKVRAMQRALADTELERDVARHVRTLERDKRFRDLLETAQVEEDAEDLRVELEALLAEGEEDAARRVYRKLTGRKFADTPAAREAKAKHAERFERV